MHNTGIEAKNKSSLTIEKMKKTLYNCCRIKDRANRFFEKYYKFTKDIIEENEGMLYNLNLKYNTSQWDLYESMSFKEMKHYTYNEDTLYIEYAYEPFVAGVVSKRWRHSMRAEYLLKGVKWKELVEKEINVYYDKVVKEASEHKKTRELEELEHCKKRIIELETKYNLKGV